MRISTKKAPARKAVVRKAVVAALYVEKISEDVPPMFDPVEGGMFVEAYRLFEAVVTGRDTSHGLSPPAAQAILRRNSIPMDDPVAATAVAVVLRNFAQGQSDAAQALVNRIFEVLSSIATHGFELDAAGLIERRDGICHPSKALLLGAAACPFSPSRQGGIKVRQLAVQHLIACAKAPASISAVGSHFG